MTKRRRQASRIGGFLINWQDLDIEGEGWGTWSDMKGDQISGVGGFSQNGWQGSYWDPARQAKDRQRQGGDSVRSGLRELEWNLVKRVSLSAAGPLLLIPGSSAPLLVLLTSPTPLHTVLFLNSLWAMVAPSPASHWLLALPNPQTCFEYHMRWCVQNNYGGPELRKSSSWLRGILVQWSVLCSNLGLAPFLFVLLEASTYLPQA